MRTLGSPNSHQAGASDLLAALYTTTLAFQQAMNSTANKCLSHWPNYLEYFLPVFRVYGHAQFPRAGKSEEASNLAITSAAKLLTEVCCCPQASLSDDGVEEGSQLQQTFQG